MPALKTTLKTAVILETSKFAVRCPSCGRSEGITIDLNDLLCCRCEECKDSYSPEVARRKAAEELARWDAVCRWFALTTELVTSPDES